MDQVVSQFELEIEPVEGYAFRVRFDKPNFPEWTTDEPPPLGHDRGPNPTRVLALAIANCLAASLHFCLSRHGERDATVSARVRVDVVRNEQKRLRVGRVAVTLRPSVGADNPALAKCMETFEDFCTVTQSVRAGIDIAVTVEAAPPA
jgi:uncharacterized OsmC-like protein